MAEERIPVEVLFAKIGRLSTVIDMLEARIAQLQEELSMVRRQARPELIEKDKPA